MSMKSIHLIAGCSVGALVALALYAPAPVAGETQAASPYCVVRDQQPPIGAATAFAYDIQSGAVLYEKNADIPRPLASLTKLATVATALQLIGSDAEITITDEALHADGDSGLVAGDQWRAGDLADFVLVTSSNDGARALRLATESAFSLKGDNFVEIMNRFGRSANLNTAYFLNETGLDVSGTTAGGYASARDAARLAAFVALKTEGSADRSVLPEIGLRSAGRWYRGHNTSEIATDLPGALLSKTGFTDLAGGNLAVVYEPLPGRPVAIAVLGSTREGREADVLDIAVFAGASLERLILCQEHL